MNADIYDDRRVFTLVGNGACSGRNEICKAGQEPCKSASTLAQCKNLCAADPKCVSLEWKHSATSSKRCQLSTTCTESIWAADNTGKNDWVLYERGDLCGDGYYAESGDISGWGEVDGIGGGMTVDDCNECAEKCSGLLACKSYECGFTKQSAKGRINTKKWRCNLNKDAHPSREKYDKFRFCSKLDHGAPGLSKCDSSDTNQRWKMLDYRTTWQPKTGTTVYRKGPEPVQNQQLTQDSGCKISGGGLSGNVQAGVITEGSKYKTTASVSPLDIISWNTHPATYWKKSTTEELEDEDL